MADESSFNITYIPEHADRRRRVCFQKCLAREGYIRATEVEEADGSWRRTGAEYVEQLVVAVDEPTGPTSEHPTRECPRTRSDD